MSSGHGSGDEQKPQNIPHVHVPRSQRDRIGRFTIERELGQGGMAEVLLAWDNLLERPVVLKRMQAALAGDKAHERLRLEAYCLAQFHDPEVLDIHDAFFGDEHRPTREPYLVTEYVQGPTLADFAAAHRPLPGEVVGLLLCSLARTLSVAHTRKILHRDVKPQNVLVDLEHPGRLVLIDFNVAKLIGHDLHLTAKGERPGSPAYMSPEQTRGWHLDARSDIFALGTLGFQLATGQLPFGPFEADTVALDEAPDRALMKRIRKGKYDEALLERARLPRYVHTVITRCLRVRREERWQSMEEVGGYLRCGLGKDGLGSVQEELKWYVKAPEAYAAEVPQRVHMAARAGVQVARLAGDAKALEERLARLMQVMPEEELGGVLDVLEAEQARRNAEAKREEKAERREEEGAAPPVPPVEPPGGGRGPKAEGVEAEAARRIAAVVAQMAADGAKRERRAMAWWKAGVMAAAIAAAMVVAAGVWWRRGPQGAGGGQGMRAVAAWTTEAGEAEAFRLAVAGMTEMDQVKEYAVGELRAGRRAVFEEMMRILDEEEERTKVSKGLLAALARPGSSTALDWMLAHMQRAPERRSAKLVALALGDMAKESFKLGEAPDPRIVPALVRITARRLAEGTAAVRKPLQALRKIANGQRLPETNRLATKVLDRAEPEGDEADAAAVEYAAILLLASGDALAEEELHARLEHSANPRVRVILELTLDKYASGTLFLVAGEGSAI